MKQTRQKTLIFNALKDRNDHPTAEMIYSELKRIDPHLSLATVYRNLNNFAASGKIRKIGLPNMKDRFDCNMEAHDHALCHECGRLIDVPLKTARKRHRMLHEFRVEEVELLYKGVCDDCLKKRM